MGTVVNQVEQWRTQADELRGIAGTLITRSRATGKLRMPMTRSPIASRRVNWRVKPPR